MAKTTMFQASKALGIPWNTLGKHVSRGIVTGERVGGVYLVDPEVARKELEQAGYYRRSAAYWEKMMARAAARGQAG